MLVQKMESCTIFTLALPGETGIIMLNLEMGIGDTVEELIVIAEVGNPEEYQDRIEYLPVT